MIKDKLNDGWWEMSIEIISSIWFSQIEPRSVEYIVRKLQIILKDSNLDNLLERIKPAIKDEKEDNVGIFAKIIFEVLDEKELTFLREKVVKNENLCNYISELVFELSFKGDI